MNRCTTGGEGDATSKRRKGEGRREEREERERGRTALYRPWLHTCGSRGSKLKEE